MAFFDDLSKKITDASTKTIQKGKDLTDVARLNSQISAEENRINTLYGMIGKQYMDRRFSRKSTWVLYQIARRLSVLSGFSKD